MRNKVTVSKDFLKPCIMKLIVVIVFQGGYILGNWGERWGEGPYLSYLPLVICKYYLIKEIRTQSLYFLLLYSFFF